MKAFDLYMFIPKITSLILDTKDVIDLTNDGLKGSRREQKYDKVKIFKYTRYTSSRWIG